MKIRQNKLLLLLLINLLLYGCHSGKNFLFIGNSLTYWNSMPDLLQKLFLQNNVNVKVEQICYPGVNLDAHINKYIDTTYHYSIATPLKKGDASPTIKKIKSRSWSYIMLQNNGYKDKTLGKSVHYISQVISPKKTQIFLYQNYIEKTPWSNERQSKDLNELRDTFNNIAQTIKGEIIPIGEVYSLGYTLYPKVRFYDKDGHPTKLGSSIIAVLILLKVTKKKPKLLTYTNLGIDSSEWHIMNELINKYYDREQQNINYFF